MDSLSRTRLLVCAGLCWLSEREILLQRRSPKASHGALAWEMPGGKVEHQESSQAALARELGEEWGSFAASLPILGIAAALHHLYPPPGPEVHLLVFHVDARSLAKGGYAERIQAPQDVIVRGFELGSLPISACLAADRDFLAGLSPYCFSTGSPAAS